MTRKLDPTVLEKTLQVIPQPSPIARQLVATARHHAPQALLRIGDETQDQFPGNQSTYQPFGVGKVRLASLWRLVRLSLRQLELEASLQHLPNRLPILGGRFHHYLGDTLGCQPTRQRLYLRVARSELTSLKPILAQAGHIGDHHREHLLMNIDTRNFVDYVHRSFFPGGEGDCGRSKTKHHFALQPNRYRFGITHSLVQRTVRIIQANGLKLPIVNHDLSHSPPNYIDVTGFHTLFMTARGLRALPRPAAHLPRPAA